MTIGLADPNRVFVEGCLSCLKTVFQHPDAPIDLLYADQQTVPLLIHLMSLCTSNQISVAYILTNACKVKSEFMCHQSIAKTMFDHVA